MLYYVLKPIIKSKINGKYTKESFSQALLEEVNGSPNLGGAGFFSCTIFSWLNPLLHLGHSKTSEFNDIPSLDATYLGFAWAHHDSRSTKPAFTYSPLLKERHSRQSRRLLKSRMLMNEKTWVKTFWIRAAGTWILLQCLEKIIETLNYALPVRGLAGMTKWSRAAGTSEHAWFCCSWCLINK